MAKPSGDKVKRGFIFYIFMLLLLVLAAFLVIVMIMLFSPFKPILGFQYFNYKQDYECVKTTDESAAAIDFSQVNKITFNSGYAGISILKSSEDESVDTIHVVNNAKGFAHADDNVNFECSVLVDKGVLSITVSEPDSFLYFSKDIRIELIVSKDNAENLFNAEVSINTKAGNVAVGSTAEEASPVSISRLSIVTDGGNIALNENASNENELIFQRLLISTKSGKVTIPESKTLVQVVGQAKFSISGNGSIKLNEIISTYGLQLAVGDGSFEAAKVHGKVSVTDIKSGKISIDEIVANDANGDTSSFVTSDAEEIGKASIKIGKVGYVAIPIGNQANIEIGTISGSSIIRTTSGHITVLNHAGTDFHFETETGSIKATIEDTDSKDVYNRTFTSVKGDIRVEFKGVVKNKHTVRTNGSVEVVLPQDSRFLLDVYNASEEPIKQLGGNFTISFIKPEDYSEHFKIGYHEGADESVYENNVVAIYGGGKINVHLA